METTEVMIDACVFIEHFRSKNKESTWLSILERQQLKQENKLIDTSDILIAATAIAHDLPLVTLNRSHFERIRDLRLM